LREQDLKRLKKEIDGVGGDALGFLLSVKPWLKETYNVAVNVSSSLREIPHALVSPLSLPLYGVPQAWGKLTFSVKDLETAVRRLRERGFVGAIPRLIDASSNMVVELVERVGDLEWDDRLEDRLMSRHGIRLLSVEDFVAYVLSTWGRPLGDEVAAKVLYASRRDVDCDYLVWRAGMAGLGDKARSILEMVSRL